MAHKNFRLNLKIVGKSENANWSKNLFRSLSLFEDSDGKAFFSQTDEVVGPIGQHFKFIKILQV